MQITVDDFLKIGNSHRICQDYIISGTDPVLHVILADGCSSSKQTDTGARILVHMAKQYLHYQFNKSGNTSDQIEYDEMGNWIIDHAKTIAHQMGLHRTALDATLMIAYLMDEQVYIHVFGDGVIGLTDGSGNLSFIEISFTSNAPYYLSYRIDPYRDQLYRENHFMKQVGKEMVSPYSAATFTFFVHEYPIIMIASDGIGSFIDKNGTKSDISTILEQFTAFKNQNGEFLKRRVKRAIRDFEKTGLSHYDDISVGAFIAG